MGLVTKWDAMVEYMEKKGYVGWDEELDSLITQMQWEVDEVSSEIQELRDALSECRADRRVWK